MVQGEGENKGIGMSISMLLIFRIEIFHGDQLWLGCYSTIYLTVESNCRLQRHFFSAVFFFFSNSNMFHDKFIFLDDIFSAEKSTIFSISP